MIPAALRSRAALLLLAMTYALSIADRYLASILIEPIKAEFGMNDATTGLVTGAAFGIFFALASIPFGWLADRANRKIMIALALVSWSLCALLSGLATALATFVIARLALGVAEAASGPAVQSLVAASHPPNQRAGAIAIIATGGAVGAGLAGFVGSTIAAAYDWRAAIITFAVLGLPLAPLLLWTVKEPVRARQGGAGRSGAPLPLSGPGYGALCKAILAERELQHLLAGTCLVTLWGWGLLWWTPALLQRHFAMALAQSGQLLGIIHMVGGLAATGLTAVAARAARFRDDAGQACLLWTTTLAGTLVSAAAFATHDRALFMGLLWLFVPITYIYVAPVAALGQSLIAPEMRGKLAAVILLLTTVANLVLAPFLIGLAADALAQRFTAPGAALHIALQAWCLLGFWATWHFRRLATGLRGTHRADRA